MKRLLFAAFLALNLLGVPLPLRADLLEEMDARLDQGVGEIRLVFSVPVRYLKHFPAERGELLKIYLQTLGQAEPVDSDVRGVRQAPALAWVPAHSVTYTTARSCYAAREPLCLDVQFSQPVQYRIRPGEDGHSLLIHVIPNKDKAVQQPAP